MREGCAIASCTGSTIICTPKEKVAMPKKAAAPPSEGAPEHEHRQAESRDAREAHQCSLQHERQQQARRHQQAGRVAEVGAHGGDELGELDLHARADSEQHEQHGALQQPKPRSPQHCERQCRVGRAWHPLRVAEVPHRGVVGERALAVYELQRRVPVPHADKHHTCPSDTGSWMQPLGGVRSSGGSIEDVSMCERANSVHTSRMHMQCAAYKQCAGSALQAVYTRYAHTR
eukprot:scaffold77134_cov63-Phaeocystis_antarctica.AAC.3